MKNQKFFLDKGLNLFDLIFEVREKGAIAKINMEATSAIIPPNFEGIDLRIA